MADDRLEKVLDVDLSQLTHTLRAEDEFHRKLEISVTNTEVKIKRAERAAQQVDQVADKALSRLRRIGKSVAQDFATSEMDSILGSSAFSRFGGNVLADALFTGNLAGAGAVALMTLYQELKMQFGEQKRRQAELEKKTEETKEKQRDQERATQRELEKQEQAFQERIYKMEQKIAAETRELLYQSSEFFER